jgi:hypothetical protein
MARALGVSDLSLRHLTGCTRCPQHKHLTGLMGSSPPVNRKMMGVAGSAGLVSTTLAASSMVATWEASSEAPAVHKPAHARGDIHCIADGWVQQGEQ